MKNHVLLHTVILAALIFGCNNNGRENIKMQANQDSINPDQDEKDIRALESEYDAAWQEGNIEALMACLTEDAVLVNPLGQIARGNTEIKKMFSKFLNGSLKGSKHKSQILRVDFITKDVAIVDGQAFIDDVEVSDLSLASALNHRFTDIVVKRNNSWAIAHIRAYTLIDND